jgi:hypothetical protein
MLLASLPAGYESANHMKSSTYIIRDNTPQTFAKPASGAIFVKVIQDF